MSATPLNILHIAASGRNNGSVSRSLASDFLAALDDAGLRAGFVERDLNNGVAFVDEDWINANFTPPEKRSADQSARLDYSDQLVAELKAADLIVISTPIYNFSVPAALKAWIDQIARARVTFQYTENGPVGLLENKRAVIAVASGGTEIGSDYDFAVDYLKHILGFIGVTDVSVIAADRLMLDADAATARAGEQSAEVVRAIAA